MLVINSNNQQDTTNFMLGGNQYPDVNQILMRGGPSCMPIYTISGTTNVTTYSVPVVETIGTTPINYYCPKIYTQGLLQGNRKRTDRIFSTGGYIMPDLGFLFQTSNIAAYYLRVTDGIMKYTVAVKGLKSGQIIGENIIAPIGRVAGIAGASNYASQGIFHIEFDLLHTDGTTTNIAGGNLTKMTSGDSDRFTDYGSNAVSTFGIHIFNYSGTGQTAQDGDILIATVSVLKAPGQSYVNIYNGEANKIVPQGIIYGNAFNMNIRDPNGFRPFQVSIRE